MEEGSKEKKEKNVAQRAVTDVTGHSRERTERWKNGGIRHLKTGLIPIPYTL